MQYRLNIEKVHPHKFRRTLATVAIDKGMPIEQLQKLLGHQRIVIRAYALCEHIPFSLQEHMAFSIEFSFGKYTFTF